MCAPSDNTWWLLASKQRYDSILRFMDGLVEVWDWLPVYQSVALKLYLGRQMTSLDTCHQLGGTVRCLFVLPNPDWCFSFHTDPNQSVGGLHSSDSPSSVLCRVQPTVSATSSEAAAHSSGLKNTLTAFCHASLGDCRGLNTPSQGISLAFNNVQGCGGGWRRVFTRGQDFHVSALRHVKARQGWRHLKRRSFICCAWLPRTFKPSCFQMEAENSQLYYLFISQSKAF